MTDYLVTAPVVLVYGNGTEEEPYMALVSANSEQEAVNAFQQDAREHLVNRGPCTDVEFYPFAANKQKYNIQKDASMPRI